MYLSMPEYFDVPVMYVEENILNIKMDSLRKNVNKKNLVIGVILPTNREDRWVREREAMEAEARFRGVALKIEYNDYDMVKQDNLINRLIGEMINVLIFFPLNQEGESQLIENAKKAGIKVLCYDVLSKNSTVDAYVGFNILKTGEIQGRYITKRAPKGNYIILTGDPNGELLKEGAMEYIKPLVLNRDINIISDGVVKEWDPQNAYNIVEEALIKSNNKVDAILAPNDAIAGAAIRAMEANGLVNKVVITGQNADFIAIRRILNGTQTMTVLNDSTKLGRIAIDVAIKLFNGEYIDYYYIQNNNLIDVPSILTEPIAVDKDNIYTVLKDTGYYKKEFI